MLRRNLGGGKTTSKGKKKKPRWQLEGGLGVGIKKKEVDTVCKTQLVG